MIFALIPLFAFLYRCRGGFLGTGHTQLGRVLYWVLPVGAWATFQSPMLAPLSALGAFLGLLIPHAAYQADASLKSVLGMAAVGVARLALILGPLAWLHPVTAAYAAVGILSGAAYFVGWKYLNGVDSGITTSGGKFLGITFAAGKFAVIGAEWGEVLTGAAFGLAFALVV